MIIDLDTTLTRDPDLHTGFMHTSLYRDALVTEFAHRIKGEHNLADVYKKVRLAAEKWWSGYTGLQDYTLFMALNDMYQQVNNKPSGSIFGNETGNTKLKSSDRAYANKVTIDIPNMKALLHFAWTNMRKHREYGFKLLWNTGLVFYEVVLMSPDDYSEYSEEFKDWTLVEYKLVTTVELEGATASR